LLILVLQTTNYSIVVMATLDIDEADRNGNQFRYTELRDTAVNPPDIIMTPLGGTTTDGRGRDPEFDEVLHEVEFAINCGILPELITSGSSGSYYVRDRNSVSYIESLTSAGN
jgi:hypothetical protein